MSQRGEGWAAGDLALCVQAAKPCADCGLVGEYRSGRVYTVSHCGFDQHGPYLEFNELPKGELETPTCVHIGYNPANFRKINPHTPDSFDHEVIEQMAGLPVGVE